MRLFIAITLPEEIKDYLYNLQKSLNTGLAKIKWVHKKNLHLTLKFLGEVDAKALEKIKDSLKDLSFSKFNLKLTEIGFFPSKNNIKVVWLGLEPKDKLIALQQLVDEQLLTLFPHDQKFSAHLTLGRAKSIKKKKEFLDIVNNIKVKQLSFDVGRIELVKSDLTKSGPVYKILEEF
ncbi:MAG: RNA 2',3'-cyclic phosphodiesterase [Nanoarchaeota archaeon]|nr:RNA 2',3'-cyclic phosphodiesterase [Nanoarchaeota archaeon]